MIHFNLFILVSVLVDLEPIQVTHGARREILPQMGLQSIAAYIATIHSHSNSHLGASLCSHLN